MSQKPFRIFMSAAGIGASLALWKGVRVGRDALGRMYVTVNIGVVSGKWYLPIKVKTDWQPGVVKPGDLDTEDGVVQGLSTLGYSMREIAAVWDKVPAYTEPLEKRLHMALLALSQQRRKTA